MAEQRWVTINGHHVLINDDEGFDTGKSDAKKGKVVSGKGAVKDVQGKKWHSETEEERAAIDKRMENARKIGIKNDVYGQLGFGNFSDEALQKAVDRGWITREQSDKIKGEEQNTAAIKSPGKQTKKQRLEAARQEVENAKNIEDVSASQLAKKYNLSSEEAGQLVWNRASNKSNKQEPLGNKGTSVGAGEMYDRLHSSKSATIKNPVSKKQTTQNKVDKLLSGRSAAASANMSKEINYQSRRIYGKSWDSLREDEKADVYEVLKRHHPEWF